MSNSETVLSILLGLSLSAAVGFRIFVPLLVMSAASMNGYLNLASGFEWIGTLPALITFGAATLFEIVGYFIPFFDNLLDTIAAPTAVIAGTIVMASSIVELNPLLKWILAIIAGGGAAGLVQSLTTIIRGTSSVTTGGIGNPIISTSEAGASFGISVLAIFFPLVVGILILLLIVWSFKKLANKFFKT